MSVCPSRFASAGAGLVASAKGLRRAGSIQGHLIVGEIESRGYNERLFSGGLRKSLHLARFTWTGRIVRRKSLPQATVLELGCFDGRAIDFLPHRPVKYVGYDANWEQGLDLAKQKWRNEPNFRFLQVSSPGEIRLQDDDVFDLAISLETLEHIPPDLLDGFLGIISAHLRGHFLVTVPNEKGVVFLAKWLVKRLFGLAGEQYSFLEVVNATIGRMDRVQRDEHKGFDYRSLIQTLNTHFDVVSISGLPLSWLPPSLSFGIAIVCRSRKA